MRKDADVKKEIVTNDGNPINLVGIRGALRLEGQGDGTRIRYTDRSCFF